MQLKMSVQQQQHDTSKGSSGLGSVNSKDSRVAEAFRIKDEQLKILSEQNAQLLKTLDQLEDQNNRLSMEKLAVEV